MNFADVEKNPKESSPGFFSRVAEVTESRVSEKQRLATARAHLGWAFGNEDIVEVGEGWVGTGVDKASLRYFDERVERGAAKYTDIYIDDDGRMIRECTSNTPAVGQANIVMRREAGHGNQMWAYVPLDPQIQDK